MRPDQPLIPARRPLRRVLVLGASGALLLGLALVAPVTGLGTALGGTGVTADAAHRGAPARVTKVGLVPKTGSRHTSLRVRWRWHSGVTKYRVQVATNKKFTKHRTTVTVRAKAHRPHGGYQEVTVPDLKNATKYRIRVRALHGKKHSGWSKTVTGKTKTHIPERFRSVTTKPGNKPGTVVFRWKEKRRYTKRYVLDLASSSFPRVKKGKPKGRGQNFHRITIPRKARSYTLSAKKAARSGVRVGSGDMLYYRFAAVNKGGKGGKKTRVWPGLHATLTAPVPPASRGTLLHVASYNVASAGATAPGTGRGSPWLDRVDKAATIINDSGASIVGLQELGPGNVIDGGSLEGGKYERQTVSLLDAANGGKPGSPWRLVRSTSYVKPGTPHATQGERILYDSTRYRLLSPCTDYTGNHDYSTSCVIPLPYRTVDTQKEQRRAAYAKFEDRTTGEQFWFVTMHLESRSGKTTKEQRSFDDIRGAQAAWVAKKMAAMNTEGLPIIATGDFNDWQNNQVSGNPPHEAMLDAGYYDASATADRHGGDLGTTTGFRTTVKKSPLGIGTRFDYVMAHGITGSVSYTNTMVRTDAHRASDHSLIHAVLRLPAA